MSHSVSITEDQEKSLGSTEPFLSAQLLSPYPNWAAIPSESIPNPEEKLLTQMVLSITVDHLQERWRGAMRHGWSIEPEPWAKLSSLPINGNQWRSVQFTVADSNSVPSVAGIYALCTPPPGRIRRNLRPSSNDLLGVLFTVVYIGQTTDLHRRFIEHCRRPKLEIRQIRQVFSECLEFWFCRMESSEIDAVEMQMIDCFGPTGNLQRGHIPVEILPPEPADSGWPNRQRN